jgi:hypothetical protein
VAVSGTIVFRKEIGDGGNEASKALVQPRSRGSLSTERAVDSFVMTKDAVGVFRTTLR